ncbi:MAG: FAD-dependent oxidoreductase [Bosea sp. (in: a-proteobacteria)]
MGAAQFSYRRAPDQDRAKARHHKVILVGAGPVGLALALDLARRGQHVLLIDDADRIGEGSRAICFAKRTLEIFDKLGREGARLGSRMLEKGVTWSKGKVFRGEGLLYEFDLLPEGGHKMPAFINLQQYYVERYMVEALADEPLIDLRWANKLAALAQFSDHVRLTIETPDGPYNATADYVVACDGARSPTRSMMGLDFAGEVFDDQFLIADVKFTDAKRQAAFPTERWFWFAPPFHAGQSALLHRQPDDVWRIDLQLSPEADAAHEKCPEVVRPRIAQMLGHEDFSLEWVSVYRFQCRRLERFREGRVIFAGDSAHQVSPFGARGANSGIQDADNLGWKLAGVVAGYAPAGLLGTYDSERVEAADENILNSTRATDFIAPRSSGERVLRDAALSLARHTGFGKRFVNSGRLSLPTSYEASPLSTPDADAWQGGVSPGAPLVDAPLMQDGKPIWLSELAQGLRPMLLRYGGPELPLAPEGVDEIIIMTRGGQGACIDAEGLLAGRYALEAGSAVLFRPDGHVAARWQKPQQAGVAAAVERLWGKRR